MCECIVQTSDPSPALPAFAGSQPSPLQASRRERLIKPRMRVRAIMLRDGRPTPVEVRWGWVPAWSMGTRSALTHLSLEQVMRAPPYARLRREGRALIPVEGWYEAACDADPGNRQQVAFVTSRRAGPLFLAAIAQAGDEHSGCDGLALITLDRGNGARQLLALDAIAAQAWLAPELDWERAQALASHGMLGEDRLEQLFTARRQFVPGRQRHAR